MYRLLGCAALGLVICLGGLSAQETKKDSKGIKGKLVKADSMANTVTIKTEDGKERTFMVDTSTKITGPRGGAVKGLSDKRFKIEGIDITVIADSSGKNAKEIHVGSSRRSGGKGGSGDNKGGG
jgi:hypothetical protein